MTETERLEPCPNPWCEADEREGDFRPQVQYSNFALVYVACTSCGMAGPTRQHEAEAIAAWNRRPSTPAAGEVGEMAAALKYLAEWLQGAVGHVTAEYGEVTGRHFQMMTMCPHPVELAAKMAVLSPAADAMLRERNQ